MAQGPTTWPTPSGAGSGWTLGGQPPNRATDIPVMEKVWLASVLGLIGVTLSAVTTFVIEPLLGLNLINTNTGSIQYNGTFSAILGATVVGFVITILSLVLLYQGFRRLADTDRQFSTPSTLIVVGMVGIVLLIIAFVVLLGTLPAAVNHCSNLNQTTPQSIPSSCPIGTLLGAAALLLFAAILTLIGIIGVMLGLWRLGGRYDETPIKVGAILYIFPLLNVVAFILILVGLANARRRLT